MRFSQKIAVRVKPRAPKDEVIAWDPETLALSIRVKAAPVDNAANNATIEVLSKFFKLPKRNIRIVGRAKSRDKIIEISSDSPLS